MNKKEKAIALMLLGNLVSLFLLTVTMVEVEKLQDRVTDIEINNLAVVKKTDLQEYQEKAYEDRETVQELRNDFSNWELMWDDLFKGRK